jgi:hypothetical protein
MNVFLRTHLDSELSSLQKSMPTLSSFCPYFEVTVLVVMDRAVRRQYGIDLPMLQNIQFLIT